MEMVDEQEEGHLGGQQQISIPTVVRRNLLLHRRRSSSIYNQGGLNSLSPSSSHYSVSHGVESSTLPPSTHYQRIWRGEKEIGY
mmetsp:Transcript_17991/g.32580  ORF Transcript_17991/g.32580 Transcript_17991/m.32580 type:complete len:84 (+) Transcript_17991:36-287(+)|eukprot:CAMPEP_0201890078 /NCGR_PEP_ID=MMETSP0902-20130614/31533_1 /ASSEMBLY_ACC=CAM_ASM_000551 /TAXON_ID=420261 /ORGANISM="Thalassiosira antarctica, Strain CCMP982" /LENGTH=83 /DNA_ID=CAMNT_0048420849 /DNA_START=122 /DNA_END=373 /DNA_ORIENTATION=+